MDHLDVFDIFYNPLSPPTASIDQVHAQGLWHQTFACWLVNRENRSVIVQLRGLANRIDPGSFDASAGGHLSMGENPKDGFREVEEELGITIPAQDRIYLGLFRNIADRNNGAYINREFCHVYLAPCPCDLKDLTLQKGEVDSVFEIDIDDAIALFSGVQQSVIIQNKDTTRHMTINDMCNFRERAIISNYYLKIMQAAKAYVEDAPVPVI